MTGMNTGYEGIRRKYDTAVFEKNELENGVKIWLQKPPVLVNDAGSLMVILPGVGSQADFPDESGIAHFFEHIPFRGTRNKLSNIELVRPINEAGGCIDAKTGPFYSFFMLETPKDSFEKALETLYEIICCPLIADENVESEKDVIENEFKSFNNKQANIELRAILKLIFANSPWEHLPIGSLKTIRGMTSEKLINFHSKYYHGGNIQIVCGGSFVEHPNAVEKIKDYFGNTPSGPKFEIDFPFDLFSMTGKEITISNPDFGRDVCYCVFPLPKVSRKDREILSFIGRIMLGTLDSVLIQELRFKRGLVYEIGLFNFDMFSDFGIFYLFLPTNRKNFKEAMNVSRDVLAELDPNYIMTKQKSRQISRKRHFDEAESVCFDVKGDIFHFGRPISHFEEESLEDEITLEDVFRWRDYFLNIKPIKIEMLA